MESAKPKQRVWCWDFHDHNFTLVELDARPVTQEDREAATAKATKQLKNAMHH